MSPVLRIVLIAGAVIVVLIAAVAVIFWQMTQQPMYRPGMVSKGQNLRAPLTPPATQPDDPDFWAVEEDIQLYHFSQGTGRPVLIVHGGPGYPYRQAWSGLEPLADQYQFNYYDQRGCGKSTRPFDTFASTNMYQNIQTLESTLGLGAQIADIERIRQILGEEKLILIGHSFGGFTAALYAAEFPEHVEALVLVSPADMLLMPPAHGGLFEAVRERLPAARQEEFDAYLKDYLNFGSIFSKSEADLMALNSAFEPYYEEAFGLPASPSEQGEVGGWMVQAQYFSLGQRHDYRSALQLITAPTLVIHGADDFQSVEVEQMYVDGIASAQLEIIGDASHFSFEEQPEVFATLLTVFLNEVLE
jgi:proline iminopeptidase